MAVEASRAVHAGATAPASRQWSYPAAVIGRRGQEVARPTSQWSWQRARRRQLGGAARLRARCPSPTRISCPRVGGGEIFRAARRSQS
eukprot:7837784-Pyramimonas_sp.AAC.1